MGSAKGIACVTNSEFTEIVERTKSAVLGAVRKTLSYHLSHSVDDVVQDTYLRMFTYFRKHGFGAITPEKLNKWAYTIARNESLRMNSKHSREIEKANLMAVQIQQTSRPETGRDDREALMDLQINLAKIPSPFKEALQLFQDGHTIEEISGITAVPVGTVKSRLSRGRKILRARQEK